MSEERKNVTFQQKMTKIDKPPLLGIFDSGVGGFSVYRRIRESSQSNCIYYGDCARAPYGNKEESEIIEFIKGDIQFLKDEGATYFVNACNSMSVMTTDRILYDCHIDPCYYTDMIRAFSKHAIFVKGEKVLVIATKATITSQVYQDFLKTKDVVVFDYICTDLAGAIESNESKELIMNMIGDVMKYAKNVKAGKILYGCTHYPLVHDIFMGTKEMISWQGEFIDPAIFVAMEVRSWNLPGEKRFTPYSSKDTPAFIKNVIALL